MPSVSNYSQFFSGTTVSLKPGSLPLIKKPVELCGPTKYPYSSHGSLEIPRRRRWVLKVKLLSESIKLHWSFLGDEGVQKKMSSVVGVWIFSGNTVSIF